MTKYEDHKNLNFSGPPHFVQEVINVKLFFKNSEYFKRLKRIFLNNLSIPRGFGDFFQFQTGKLTDSMNFGYRKWSKVNANTFLRNF